MFQSLQESGGGLVTPRSKQIPIAKFALALLRTRDGHWRGDYAG
jgi:hypothetical protein